MFDPRIDKHLIADQGELVIDEVHKHWAAHVGAVLELCGGLVVLALSVLVPAQAWWLPFTAGAAIAAHAGWRILERRMDRFVITNMRVFRVHGILSQRIATMPLARILDISVHKPFIGRIFGYGHFVFESAAQEQGLREIRFVGDPDRRGLTIQRVIQQAGLRGSVPGQPFPVAAQPAPPPPDLPAVPASEAAEAWATQPHVRLAPPQREPGPKTGWDWLADAQQREHAHLARLRGEDPGEGPAPFDPDGTPTSPIPLPR
ncbi:PH domain-containing protein [Microbacterium sp. NPDC019599]|uniref:PH domain-containing protein n=1 Tax=Microbacterium sp. NPDC019599 TaxID=3154690 RepID=UPI0033E4DF8E